MNPDVNAVRTTGKAERWVNIHAGLDETSNLLTALFPFAEGKVLDIFDSREMTEPSIEQARRTTPTSVRPFPRIGAPCLFRITSWTRSSSYSFPMSFDGMRPVYNCFASWRGYCATAVRWPSSSIHAIGPTFWPLARGSFTSSPSGHGCERPTPPVCRCELFFADSFCSCFHPSEDFMTLQLPVQIVGALLLSLGIAHSLFNRYFG